MRISQADAINTGAFTTISLAALANQRNYRSVPDRWGILSTIVAGPQNFGVQINGDDPFNGARGTCIDTQNQGSYGTSDSIAVYQAIDGLEFEPLFGRNVTLSFWTKTTNTGRFPVAIEYGSSVATSSNQVFLTSYNVSLASTWTFNTVSFSFPTTLGGPNPFDANQQMRILFPVFVGSVIAVADSVLNAWQAAGVVTALRSASQVNAMQVNNDRFALTRASLQVGSATIPLDADFNTELLRCQRYYWHTFAYGTRPQQNLGAAARLSPIAYRPDLGGVSASGVEVKHAVDMRAAPTVTYYNPDAANANWRNLTAAADSGAAASVAALSGTKSTYVENPQVAGDNSSDNLVVAAEFDARL